jgi:hypothetical protein
MANEILNEENPAEKYAAWIVKNVDKKGTAEFNTVATAYKDALNLNAEPKASVQVSSPEGQPLNTQFGETGGGAAVGRPQGINRTNVQPEPRPLESALAGATKSMVDLPVGAAQLATGGNLGTSQLAQNLAKQGETYSQANPISYGAGRLAGALAPATGISKGIGMIPSFERMAQVIPKAAPYVQSGLTGGAATIMTPEETGKTNSDLYKEQAKNAALNSLIAAPLPILSRAFGVAKEAGKAVIEPFSESGKNIILGRALRNMSGNDAEKAIANLRNPKVLVPGSNPTAAEVAEVPSIAAAQRTATAISPEATNALAYRQAEQNTARQAALETAGGTQKEKNILEMARSNVAKNAYDKALNKEIDFKALPKELVDEAKTLRDVPAIKNAAAKAKINALNAGIDIKNPAGSIAGLHQTKMALDREIKAVEAKLARDNAGATSSELDGLKAAKNRLLSFIENDAISPEYKQARNLFEKMSKPITQMQVVQEAAKSSINPLTGQIYPQKLAGNVQKLKEAGIVTPKQLETLNAVKEDLARSKFAAEAGKNGGSDTVQKLAYSNMLNQINLPNLLRRNRLSATVGNALARGSDVAYSGANKELANKLALSLMNPKDAAALMKLAGKEAKNAKLTPEQTRTIQLLMTEGLQNARTGLQNE